MADQPLTPAQKVLEARRRRAEQIAAEIAARPAPPPASEVIGAGQTYTPTFDIGGRAEAPDPETARFEALRAMIDLEESRSAVGVGPDGVSAAYRAAQAAGPALAPVEPKDTSWGDQLGRSFTQQVIRPDGRVTGTSATERARIAAEQLLYGATMPLRPIERLGQEVQDRVGKGGIVDAIVPDVDLAESVTGVRRTTAPEIAGDFGRGIEELGAKAIDTKIGAPIGAMAMAAGLALQAPEAVGGRSKPTMTETGLKAENEVMYLMRVLSTVSEAGVTELMENAPVGPPKVVREGEWEGGGTLFEQVVRNLTPLRLGDLAGVTDRAATVDRGNPLGNMTQGFLERVERGEGFEMDSAMIAKNLLGPEWENTGYVVGLLISILGNWEGAVARGPRVVAKVADGARALGEIDGARTIDRAAKYVSNGVIDAGETFGRSFADEVETGVRRLDELPEALRPFIDDVARYEYQSTFDEIAFQDGLGPEPRPDLDQKAREATPMVSSVSPNIEDLREPVAVEDLKPGVLDEKSTAPGTLYVVRNKGGEAVGTHRTLDDAIKQIRERGVEGDEPWRSGQRPVARWVEIEREPVREHKMVATKQPDGTFTWDLPPRPPAKYRLVPTRGAEGTDALALKRILKDEAPREIRPYAPVERKAAGKVLFDAANGKRTPTTAPATRVGDIIRKAASLWARDRLGSDELAILPTGAPVSIGDKRRILGRVLEDLEQVGIGWRDDGDLSVLTGRKKLTDDQLRGMVALAKRWGVEKPNLSPQGLRELQNAGVRFHGGVLADARYRVRGMRKWSERFQQVLADVHSDRVKWTRDIKDMTGLTGSMARLGLGLAGAFTKAFFDAPSLALAPQVKAEMLRTRSRMERAGDDVVGQLDRAFGEFRKDRGIARYTPLNDSEMAAVMSGVFQEFRPVHADEVRQLTTARDALASGDEAAILKVADDLGARLPKWARDSDDPRVRAAGVRHEVQRIEELMETAGQEYLSSLVASRGVNLREDSLRKGEIRFRTPEVLQRIYVEAFVDGEFLGPTTREQVARIAKGEPDAPRSMLAFMVLQRQKQIVREGFGELVKLGAIVQADELFVRSQQSVTDATHALTQALNGTHFTDGPDGSRVYRLPAASAAWVDRTLWAMGLEPGSGAALSTVRFSDKLGAREFVLPKAMQDEMIRAMTGGSVKSFDEALTIGTGDPRLVAKAVDEVWRMWKTFATTGFVLPRPSYYVGQWLGQGQTLWLTRGIADAARAMPAVTAQFAPGALSRHSGTVGELVMRLHTGETGTRFVGNNPASQFVRSSNGTLYHLDDLERLARDFGLADTIVAFETMPHLQRIIAQENTLLGRITMPVARWQEMLRGYAGGFDQAARLAVFVQELERGADPAAAAVTARKAALDFRDLTEFEAQNLRWGFTFYAYMRKATDTLWTALLNHPERVMQQMRLAHWSFARDKTAAEIGASDDREVARLRPGKIIAALTGRAWEGDAFDKSGRLNSKYVWSFQTAPVSISDVLLIQLMVYDTLTYIPRAVAGDSTASLDRLADNVAPQVDVPMVLVTGRRTGREVDSDRSNFISPMFTDGIGGETLRWWFAAGPVALDPDRDDPADLSWSATMAIGTPAKWAAGASAEAVADEKMRAIAVRNYQVFMNVLGGPALTNVEQWARIAWPRMGLSRQEEAMYAIGLTPMKERTYTEAVEAQLAEQEREAERIERRAQQLTP